MEGMSECKLFKASMLRLSKSGRAAAISSAVGCLSYLAGGRPGSEGGKASGTGSNFGRATSRLNLIESSVGWMPF